MVRSVRRILAGNNEAGRSVCLTDEACPDVWLDEMRPGYASTMVWVSDRTPAPVKGIRRAPALSQRLAPPAEGSMCRYIEVSAETGAEPRPDAIHSFFAAMNAPDAAVAGGRHPYMQKTSSLDFCYILEGDVSLVLDTGDVALTAGDVVINNGAAHAWSNHSAKPCVIILSQHGARSEVASAFREPPNIYPHGTSDSRKNIRRVVTGTDATGQSCVVFDGATPNVFPRSSGSYFYELWTVDAAPPDIVTGYDGGDASRPFTLSPPDPGLHWRVSFLPPTSAAAVKALEKSEGHGTERRDGGAHPGMHRTPTLDYAICIEGERLLVLEEEQTTLRKGDVVIQLGGWHTWARGADVCSMMSYVMIGGEFG